MYDLSQNKCFHKRDLRCLDLFENLLVTGGSDSVFKMFEIDEEKLHEIVSISDIFSKNILSVRINRHQGGEISVLAGCADGKVFAFDRLGTPIAQFQNSSAVSSIDFINKTVFVVGCWDGKAIVWNSETRQKVSEYSNHKYAVTVFYNKLNNSVVSGSQDKALACWNWQDGKQSKRLEGAHSDIIREITGVEEVGFLTCSNDESIKLWSSDLEEIQRLQGHTAFIFTCKSSQLGSYFSGGEDKTIRIWNDASTAQTLQCPASIWSLAVHKNGDIYAGCSDGFLRVFTTQSTRRAPSNQVQAFHQETLNAASKKSGMSAEDIKKLATIQQMQSMVGKKDGEIRVFKNGAIPEAFMWQNGKWDKIGQVITEGGQPAGGGGMSQSKYYPGDKYFDAGEYDYIFDVDDQSGAPKRIPFNDGGNALQSAQKYCMRQGLSKGYLEQIRQFLMQNSSKIPRKAIQQSQKQVTQDNMRTTPQCIPMQYTDIKNTSALFNKIKQFNQKIQTPNCKLNDRQLEYCERIITLLEKSSNYHSWKLDFKEMDTIKKLLLWPRELKFPVWDVLRAFLLHYQSEALFSGLDAGLDIINQLAASIEQENSQPIYALLFRTLANILIQNTNKNAIIKHANTIFSSVEEFCKKGKFSNKGLQSAIAGFLFNFSISIYQKNLENQQIIVIFSRILKVRISEEENQENICLMLQAAANTIFKYQNLRQNFTFLKNHLLNNEVSKDLQLLLQ